MRSRLGVLISLTLIISSFGFTARAQSGSASIVGTIVTEDGSTLPGVTVSVRCKCSKTCPSDPDCSCCPAATYVTDASGKFRFAGLTPGDYDIRAELPGYTTSARTVSVRSGEQEVQIVMRTSVTVRPANE